MAAVFSNRLPLLAFLFYLLTLVAASSAADPPFHLWHQRRALADPPTPSSLNVSSSTLQEARKLVASAVAQQSRYNAYRVANPKRNTYETRPSGTNASSTRKRSDEPEAPVLDAKLRAAAALLAERHAAQQLANGTLYKSYSEFTKLPKPLTITKRDDDSSYWPSLVSHGVPPMGWDPSYPVYRDVTDSLFGAKGDGVTDDTDAINAAIAYGGSCEEGCESSSVKGTFIYFPPGTYLISSPINASYYSQLVGNPNDLPTIKTSPSFIGLGAIQSDVYIPNDNGDEWYVEQSNFYRQVRNLIIDIHDTTTAYAAGLHWQVAQATSLTNVYITASDASGTTQMGIYTENGSGGFMSGCSIVGGQYGIYGGNQQYTVRGFQISSQTKANICLLWDWGWTWADMYLTSAPVGISLIDPEDPTGQQAGSTYILDTMFDETTTAIEAKFQESTILDTSIITLDNIGVNGVDTMVAFTDDTNLDLPEGDVDFVIIGNIKDLSSQAFGSYSVNVQTPPSPLLGDDEIIYRETYFYKNRPQYEILSVDDIVSVTDHGATGDGSTDDTAAIVAALALATTDNLIYFPPGSYLITETIVIPAKARITGQVWSQLVASGDYFANMTDPKPMIQVGNAGDVGTVEISDILFTSIGELPGLIMVEWNVQAESQGSVGMWDSHFRVGGAYGTKLQVAECPASGSIESGCVAASMILHMTAGSNGYFENMWLWVADHDIDDADNTQITVAVARGFLLDSTSGPTWLYGTASEHSMLYQYNFANATNTLAGMIQTESPYFQATDSTESPGPFNSSMGLFTNDPEFPDSTCNATAEMCDFAWAVIMKENTNLTVAGAGLYSWYDDYLETCVDTQNCQQRLVLDSGDNGGLYFWNLITIGAVEMISNTAENDIILAKNNTQAMAHPYWSALAAYLDDYEQEVLSCPVNSTEAACLSTWKCDLSKTYATVEDLNSAASDYPDQCMPYYALGTLFYTLNTTMYNYTAANKDYDKYFKYYQQYVREMVPDAIDAFMAASTPNQPDGGAGNKYFDCTCEGYGPTSTQTCPFRYTQLSGATSYIMTYTLKNATGFYDELYSTYGINSSWVEFVDKGGPVHEIGHCIPGECSSGTDYRYVGLPQAVKSSKIDVSNPKDIITAALPSIGKLKNNILARNMDLNLGAWTGASQDLISTFSLPVFMLNQAVASMASVKAIGEKQAKEDKIKLILEILGIVFAFVPFLDDITPELELLDGAFETVAATGNVALGIQSIVSDPTSAPMVLLGLIAGGGLKDDDDFAETAAAARELTEDDLESIGKDFKEEEESFTDLTKITCDI
ncbi:exo-1,3-beta-D-glucanase [Aspergillus heteromorphus CBS 117.55]|uniref:Exo-1,3-beta-D-glucanase n=1 Tax=Aspergillus heteromorphus CBS 117.55 TaxID=1448321 RepID=A0A317WT52_9EURO|nr:exo-1,3-beta-D-glucanase [Aspergillus heteromorphus CBS 117.55]PWY88961.1 exo-1,3-beta-D-glucanase [Aspergillus heteromorphus CBS 117.55]